MNSAPQTWPVKHVRRTAVASIALLYVLLTCNITFVDSSGWARLFWNLLGYCGLFLVYRLGKLTPADTGLEKSQARNGVTYGAIVAVVVLAGSLIFFLFDRSFFMDSRYHHSLGVAVYATIVLLPLKTVLFEELAFRGIFLGLALKLMHQRLISVITTSLAFGLWHVSSSMDIGSYHLSSGIIIPQLLVVGGAVIITAAASMALCELRLRSHSLIAPIMTHWALNGFAILLASLSWR
jgi:membrane protease YdiL (CAAX protease family)